MCITFDQQCIFAGQEHKGKPVYCWFRFEANPEQLIHVDVHDVRAGMYDENQRE